jgi:hypothetical protein
VSTLFAHFPDASLFGLRQGFGVTSDQALVNRAFYT